MIKYFFSDTTKGFYNSDINKAMPASAVEISKNQWLEAINSQDKTPAIKAGKFCLEKRLAPTSEEKSESRKRLIPSLMKSIDLESIQYLRDATESNMIKLAELDAEYKALQAELEALNNG